MLHIPGFPTMIVLPSADNDVVRSVHRIAFLSDVNLLNIREEFLQSAFFARRAAAYGSSRAVVTAGHELSFQQVI